MLQFHATPPRGEWFNDPNGLVVQGGVRRLFVQHRCDAPDFRATGWATLSSTDLLRWTFEGAAIPAGASQWAYSGSVRARADGLEAWHTEHALGLEHQLRRRSDDGGRSWSTPDAHLGPPRRDWRDPFVFSDAGVDYMALASPCPWTDDGAEARSIVEVHASRDGGASWRKVGAVGPWAPPRIMWETPFLSRDADGLWSFVVSEVDRRLGRALCSVRRWRGHWKDGAFTCADPADGRNECLDFGPDFYACAPAAFADATTGDRIVVGWASSWETARRFPWPGFHGGPISLPRRLTPRGSAPLASICEAFDAAVSSTPAAGLGHAEAPGAFRLRLSGAGASLAVACAADGALDVERRGAGLDWSGRGAATFHAGPRRIAIFVDGPLAEIHLGTDDRWITAAIPVAGPLEVTIDGAPPFAWRTLG